MELQKRRCVGPQVEVSPNSERRHEPTLASVSLQRILDSHGGGIDGEESASRKKPVVKPMSRHASSGVLWTAHRVSMHQYLTIYTTMVQVSGSFPNKLTEMKPMSLPARQS